jgi:hypothetical protein
VIRNSYSALDDKPAVLQAWAQVGLDSKLQLRGFAASLKTVPQE